MNLMSLPESVLEVVTQCFSMHSINFAFSDRKYSTEIVA